MRRRAWTLFAIVTLPLGILAAPLVAVAQQTGKVYRIGFLRRAAPNPAGFEAFRQGLRDLGYVEGQNSVIEQRYAAGVYERLADLAAELVGLKVDVIVVDGVLTAQAAQKVTTTIPIVFTLGDPIQIGLVASLARPGGNVTGLTTSTEGFSGKRLELLKEAVPYVSRVAVLNNPANPAFQLEETQEAARLLGLQLHLLEPRSPNELASAFTAMAREGVGALITLPDAMFFSERVQIAKLAAESRLPAMFPERDFVDAGGLMAYGPNIADNFRRAATYVDKILKGTKPGDLPIEQPMRFTLVINLKTAQALKLTIPPQLLFQADEVIR